MIQLRKKQPRGERLFEVEHFCVLKRHACMLMNRWMCLYIYTHIICIHMLCYFNFCYMMLHDVMLSYTMFCRVMLLRYIILPYILYLKYHTTIYHTIIYIYLGGGFKYILFSSLPREMIQFDLYFSGWVETTNWIYIYVYIF